MKPHIEKLIEEGYSIQMIDIDNQPTLIVKLEEFQLQPFLKTEV